MNNGGKRKHSGKNWIPNMGKKNKTEKAPPSHKCHNVLFIVTPMYVSSKYRPASFSWEGIVKKTQDANRRIQKKNCNQPHSEDT